jgi:hypothetical protein
MQSEAGQNAQPGILEAQRKQAAMTILAILFDSLRRFRKQVGPIRLCLIQNFLADGRLIRIGPISASDDPVCGLRSRSRDN